MPPLIHLCHPYFVIQHAMIQLELQARMQGVEGRVINDDMLKLYARLRLVWSLWEEVSEFKAMTEEETERDGVFEKMKVEVDYQTGMGRVVGRRDERDGEGNATAQKDPRRPDAIVHSTSTEEGQSGGGAISSQYSSSSLTHSPSSGREIGQFLTAEAHQSSSRPSLPSPLRGQSVTRATPPRQDDLVVPRVIGIQQASAVAASIPGSSVAAPDHAKNYVITQDPPHVLTSNTLSQSSPTPHHPSPSHPPSQSQLSSSQSRSARLISPLISRQPQTPLQYHRKATTSRVAPPSSSRQSAAHSVPPVKSESTPPGAKAGLPSPLHSHQAKSPPGPAQRPDNTDKSTHGPDGNSHSQERSQAVRVNQRETSATLNSPSRPHFQSPATQSRPEVLQRGIQSREEDAPSVSKSEPQPQSRVMQAAVKAMMKRPSSLTQGQDSQQRGSEGERPRKVQKVDGDETNRRAGDQVKRPAFRSGQLRLFAPGPSGKDGG